VTERNAGTSTRTSRVIRARPEALYDAFLTPSALVELAPPHRIVEAVTFVTTDPALLGEMMHTVTFDPAPGGTEVTLLFENLPPGVRPEDNDAGARLSLDQLARRFE
jgi:hypothetical protein